MATPDYTGSADEITPRPRTLPSRPGRTWFERGELGLAKLLERAWLEGRYYVGEWRSDPEGRIAQIADVQTTNPDNHRRMLGDAPRIYSDARFQH